jgi:hypothetical protein
LRALAVCREQSLAKAAPDTIRRGRLDGNGRDDRVGHVSAPVRDRDASPGSKIPALYAANLVRIFDAGRYRPQ